MQHRLLGPMCALVVVGLAASCRDSTGPRGVARLDVSGAPSAPLIVGTTLQLSATAEDAGGDTLTGRTTTWSSSDARVATVSATGLVTAVGPGSATVHVSVDQRTDTVPLDVRVGAVIGSAGGIVSLDSTVILTVPRGVLAQPTPITVRAVAATGDPHLVTTQAYEFAPSTLVFQKPATLTLAYDRAKLPTGVAQGSLVLGILAGTSWLPVLGGAVDTTRGIVTGPVTSAASYAVLWRRVAMVQVPGSDPDSLYVGESSQLSVLAFDSTGVPLPARTTTWSSSAPSVARVDSTGRVTAVDTGTTTITATVEGQSARRNVVVSGGLVVDWSHAADWTTYQGSTRHDGYVAATMNPRRFHVLWTEMPVGGAPLHPVAVVDSTVVLTANDMNLLDRIAVLDATTGNVRWSYDFGAITWLGPPAFVGGVAYVETQDADSLYLWGFVASTGEIRFRKALSATRLEYVAPSVVGQAVYATADSGVHAVSSSGTRLWFTPTTFAAGSPEYLPTPAVAGGRVYAWDDATPAGLAVLDTTGAVVYTIPDSTNKFDPNTATGEAPVLGGSNDLLAISGGRLASFDLVGRKIGWQVSGNYDLTPAVAGGIVYAVNGSAVEARAESDGSLLWSWTSPSGSLNHPVVVSNNVLFVSSTSTTYALDLASHVPVWTYGAGGALAVSREGVLFVSLPNGTLTAIALE